MYSVDFYTLKISCKNQNICIRQTIVWVLTFADRKIRWLSQERPVLTIDANLPNFPS